MEHCQYCKGNEFRVGKVTTVPQGCSENVWGLWNMSKGYQEGNQSINGKVAVES